MTIATTNPQTVREYEDIVDSDGNRIGLDHKEYRDFGVFLEKPKNFTRPVLKLHNGVLRTRNYVGIIQTRSRVLEILPKVDLVKANGEETDGDSDHERTREVFLRMLRAWRNMNWVQLDEGDIRALRHFGMLDVFVRVFLNNLVRLTKRGLAMNYQPIEENLPCLKGKIVFAEHIRHNMADMARFYVRHDEFTANRPVNRLIRSTIDKLILRTHEPINCQLLHQMRIFFDDVPLSRNHRDDWGKHRIDRAIPHYRAVMQWVGLFLFGDGLSTFSGKHTNDCLLFPMEQVFEDYVAHAFRKYQRDYQVHTQVMKKHLAITEKGGNVFWLKPDILLMNNREAFYVMDTKWKRINGQNDDEKRGISQSDMYQLYAYGKKYKCSTVVLIYPRTEQFCDPIWFQFSEELHLLCHPFDVSDPKTSVIDILETLHGREMPSKAA